MIEVSEFYRVLKDNDINFFCGVPDSLLQDFCAYLFANTSKSSHIITANEGNALALACGHYLATNTPGVVYMQNSGIGNAVNPLLSLSDENVYNIPILLIIGWRGEPGVKDEPQHFKQGLVTEELLKVLGIKYCVLDSELVRYAPRYLKACSALDAFCQGIESFWSNKSNSESLRYAEKAIVLSKNNIEKFVNSDDYESANNMLQAAHFSGKAINISKTTAAHAVSYQLTSKYNIPHGHAVSFSIVNNFIYNQMVSDNDINDGRGVLFVKNQLKKLQELLEFDDPRVYFRKLFSSIGICVNHTKLGITNIKSVTEKVNQERLSNNPKKLSCEELNAIIINPDF